MLRGVQVIIHVAKSKLHEAYHIEHMFKDFVVDDGRFYFPLSHDNWEMTIQEGIVNGVVALQMNQGFLHEQDKIIQKCRANLIQFFSRPGIVTAPPSNNAYIFDPPQEDYKLPEIHDDEPVVSAEEGHDDDDEADADDDDESVASAREGYEDDESVVSAHEADPLSGKSSILFMKKTIFFFFQMMKTKWK